MCDLQLRKVINSSSELRFGCSWTILKAHLVKILDGCLWRAVGVGSGRTGAFEQVR